MTDRSRETFVAEFGEEQASAIENAALTHVAGDMASFDEVRKLIGDDDGPEESMLDHANDDHGDQPFQYSFLLAIARECITSDKYREYHGVTADVEAMKEWAKDPERGSLGGYSGDIPDYVALFSGVYEGWVGDTDGASEQEQAGDVSGGEAKG